MTGSFRKAEIAQVEKVEVVDPLTVRLLLKAPFAPLVAQLTQGQRVGTLKVSKAGGTEVASVSLVVQEAVPEAGLFGRAWDSLRLWIK